MINESWPTILCGSSLIVDWLSLWQLDMWVIHILPCLVSSWFVYSFGGKDIKTVLYMCRSKDTQ